MTRSAGGRLRGLSVLLRSLAELWGEFLDSIHDFFTFAALTMLP
jgi:hypothetical protein